MQFLRFRPLISDGLHGKMQHHLITVAMGLFRDFNGVGMIREHRHSNRNFEGKNGVGSGAIIAQVIEYYCETSALRLWRSGCFASRSDPFMKMNHVGYYARAAVGIQNSLAAFQRTIQA